MCFLPVNKDNQLTLKWGEGGVNRPTWESICPIHIAVQNGDMVCRYKKNVFEWLDKEFTWKGKESSSLQK